MKGMLKLMLVLALVFASTFIILNATGVLTLDRIQLGLNSALQVSPMIAGSAIIF